MTKTSSGKAAATTTEQKFRDHKHGSFKDQLLKEYKVMFIDRWLYVLLAVATGVCLLSWLVIIES